MKPYTHYSAEELALDDLFVRWVQHPGDEEVEAFWANIKKQPGYRSDVVETARQLVQQISQPSFRRLSTDDVASLWGRIRESLGDHEDVRTLRPEIQSFVQWWYFARTVAAIVGIMMLIGWALWMQSDEALQTIRTGAGQMQSLRLPDGSGVNLQPNSELRYAQKWSADAPRAVWLHGQADFTVVSKTKASNVEPFRVHTPGLTVEARGTAFRVTQSARKTRVSLHTGNLNLLIDNQPNSVSLCPGQWAEIQAGQPVLVSQSVHKSSSSPEKVTY